MAKGSRVLLERQNPDTLFSVSKVALGLDHTHLFMHTQGCLGVTQWQVAEAETKHFFLPVVRENKYFRLCSLRG